ncbi:uncharacterized protein Tco025E_03176 [Trypanosoma conorhini]|uniref:Uncharacterized protein n=1 Tax=Trypanosoma conorhini TaxID=83891 RepID=A0A3R7PMK5_9TRYP|nr:uncharacterized protein Tco025E_03176 [Trypanosoma conorhini]RNF22244.1 hypothetical protein Tco025E_03176 [Trypanosoma conorhini]
MRRTWIRLGMTTVTNGGGGTTITNTAAAPAAAAAAAVVLPLQSQRRIREIMVRRILLSSKPLTSHEFVELVRREYHQVEAPAQSKSGSAHEAEGAEGPATRAAGSRRRSDVEVMGDAAAHNPVAYLRGYLSSASTETAGTPPARAAAAPCPVEATVRLLLALDSQFRLSSAGYVCYPNLPSLFLASSNVDQDAAWVQAGRRILRADEARPRGSGGDVAVRAATGEGAGEASRWTYMLSLWFMLDALAESVEAVGEKGAATGSHGAHASAFVSTQLMHHWIAAADARELPPLLLQELAAAGQRDVPSARCVSTSLELRESVEGNDMFRRWCSEAREGYMSDILLHAPQLTQTHSLLLQQVNDQLAYLFTFMLGAPIPLGRLSALIQWASLPFAEHYRSLLHFLLLYAGNPAVAQMERQLRRRRKAQKRWTDVLRSRLKEADGRRWHPGKSYMLAGRYASRERVEETPGAAFGSYDHGGASGGKESGERRISSELCALWLRNSGGTLVNAKETAVCRCLFLQPAEMTPLEVTTQTPSEVLEGFAGAAGVENDVVVFSVLPYVFERRVCRVIRAWWALEGQYTTKVRPSGAVAVVPVWRLCQLCLWEHEYGAAAASKMMLHYLRSVIVREASVQLLPPPTVADATATPMEDAGRWLVALRSTTEEL